MEDKTFSYYWYYRARREQQRLQGIFIHHNIPFYSGYISNDAVKRQPFFGDCIPL